MNNLFSSDFGNSIAVKTQRKIKMFNRINIKINSLINYLCDLNEEEYEEFFGRLKDFLKEEDYTLYHIKDLSTYLGIPLNESLKFILAFALTKEERLVLQKRFGLTYEGFLQEDRKSVV